MDPAADDRAPIPPPPPHLVFVGDGDFQAVGEEFLRYFVEWGGLAPYHRVLDVGCGIGRMAVPLTRYLAPSATYDGFDIVAHGIEWCRQEITTRFPSFRFQLADVRNGSYHPRGRAEAARYTFPYADGAFDFVFLTSVFTHMVPAALERYVGEIARVLAHDGRVLMTFFLLNPESVERLEAGRSSLDLRHPIGACRVMDRDVPERAIAHPESRVRELLASHGLKVVEPVRYGGWCGRPGAASYQDVLVARR
jgi:SAM-dependent methyltransferase